MSVVVWPLQLADVVAEDVALVAVAVAGKDYAATMFSESPVYQEPFYAQYSAANLS